MHAILQARYLNDDYVGNLLDYKRTGNTAAEEPVCFPWETFIMFLFDTWTKIFKFLDGEGIAEAGHYMEQLFFGGCEIRYRKFVIPINLKGKAAFETKALTHKVVSNLYSII